MVFKWFNYKVTDLQSVWFSNVSDFKSSVIRSPVTQQFSISNSGDLTTFSITSHIKFKNGQNQSYSYELNQHFENQTI